MKVSVFGLGYVGSVTAACLAEQGHAVVGVDVNERKVAQIRAGESPVLEPGLAELLRAGVEAGRITATSNVAEAIRLTELSIVCVGTPSKLNGDLDLSYVERVMDEIASALRGKQGEHEVVLRSTVLPGTCEHLVERMEKRIGWRHGLGWTLAVNPEFLREGTALADFRTPTITVVGTADPEHGRRILELYRDASGRVFRMRLREAELVKYACNAFHATKIGFANELGRIARAGGIDSWKVMEALCADDKLNISKAYLRPGFAFGGSCLPKDLRALNYRARSVDVEAPLLGSILRSNDVLIDELTATVLATGRRRLAVLGLAFKKDTDDLRESPMVRVCERFLGKGLELAIFDPSIRLDLLVGANRAYIEKEIPHLARLLRTSAREAAEGAEVLVIGLDHPSFAEVLPLLREGQLVFDLARLVKDPAACRAEVRGIAWTNEVASACRDGTRQA